MSNDQTYNRHYSLQCRQQSTFVFGMIKLYMKSQIKCQQSMYSDILKGAFFFLISTLHMKWDIWIKTKQERLADIYPAKMCQLSVKLFGVWPDMTFFIRVEPLNISIRVSVNNFQHELQARWRMKILYIQPNASMNSISSTLNLCNNCNLWR